MSEATTTPPADRAATDEAPVLETRGIVKRYGSVVALAGVDFQLHANETVGLVGDNGAGKSTLIKVLSGAVHPDEGEIVLHGRPVTMATPRDAQAHGIETVYQDLALFDELSIAANIFAGREKVGPGKLLRESEMCQFSRDVIKRLGVGLPDPRTPVRNLSGGQRQAVAVARSVGFGSRIVILDEPTSALSTAAAEHVLDIVRDLRRHDVAAIFIGHNLDHVMDVCDRLVVLRQGRVNGTLTREEFSLERIVALMVGS